MRMRTRLLGLAVASLLAAPSLALADTSFEEAQRFYDGALYTRALETLDQLSISAPSASVHEYRALCLIALGRPDAAERAMTEIVNADPFFNLDRDVASPRVLAQFAGVRRRLLPPIVRRGFAEATALYREGAAARALERFAEVQRLLDDPVLKNDQGLADLGLAASAFVALARAQATPAPLASAQVPVLAVALPRVPASEPAAPSPALAGAAPAPSATSSQPAPSQPPGATLVTGSAPAAFAPAVALVRPLPKWTPPDARSASMTFAGAISVGVDERGRVISVASKHTVHPAYDPMLLAAARGWLFEPARQHGRPVRSEVTVEIQLLPPGN
jgi:hypothetical protein